MEIIVIFYALLILGPLLLSVILGIFSLVKPDHNSFDLFKYFLGTMSIILYPCYFLTESPKYNYCCADTAPFAFEHTTGLYALIILCISSYIISYSKLLVKFSSFPPIIEVLINSFLLIGFILNVVISFQLSEIYSLIAIGLGLIFLFELVENHRYFILNKKESGSQYRGVNQVLWQFLCLPIFTKVPIFLLFLLPVVIIFTTILVLFGQEPDALIRVFTDTYYHGFSQLNHECDDVICQDGDCYVCTVAATGNTAIVRYERMGIRNGRPIKCSRQLLVASAFEKLWSDKLPRTHRLFRSGYDAFGSWLQNNPSITRNTIISTLGYLFLKPFEWLFLLVLYTFYQKPENIIASRYLSVDQASVIEKTQGTRSCINPIEQIKINLK